MESTPCVIFLVEGNELYIKIMRKYIKEHTDYNIIIHSFSNGADCIKNLNLKPGIIILDYDFISKDGLTVLDVLKKIRSIEPKIATILLSLQDNIKVATKTMRYGVYDFILKGELTFFDLQNDINNIILERRHHKKFRTIRKTRFFIGLALILILGVIIFIIISYFDWIKLLFS